VTSSEPGGGSGGGPGGGPGGAGGSAAELIWMRPERPSRGPQPAHSRAEIAAAAVRVADKEGIDAVSMRRVAAEIGAGTMSLYRYVPKKEQLYELMVDLVAGEYELPATASGDWQADLRALAGQQRAMVHRHPWLPAVVTGRMSLGPNALRYFDWALGALAGVALAGPAKMELLAMLSGFVLSFTQWELSEAQARRRAGLSEEQWSAAYVAYVTSVVQSGKYPNFARVVAEGGTSPDAEALFDRGMTRILAGVAADLPS
jgi:AcrR family transcriptional regulator